MKTQVNLKPYTSLSRDRCSMIVNVEYRCPECEKVFNCPANLASHRRWHKPKDDKGGGGGGGGSAKKQPNGGGEQYVRDDGDDEGDDDSDAGGGGGDGFGCEACGRRFRKMAALRKHLLSHELAVGVGDVTASSNINNNTSANSKSYSIAELLSPRKGQQQVGRHN